MIEEADPPSQPASLPVPTELPPARWRRRPGPRAPGGGRGRGRRQNFAHVILVFRIGRVGGDVL